MTGIRIGGVASIPVWPPIVPYVRKRLGDDGMGNDLVTSELAIVPQAGGAPSIVKTLGPTVDGESMTYPLASPDYSRIAYFQSDSIISGALRVIGADGSGDTELVASDMTTAIAWDPDGTRILAIKSGVGFEWVELDGTETPISIPGGTGVGRMSISPDGSKIAYWDTVNDDVRVMDADGSNNSIIDGTPATTSQDQRLAYAHAVNMVGYGESVSGEDYWRILDDGTGLTQMNPPSYLAGSNPIVTHHPWEPDDEWMVAQNWNASAPRPAGGTGLWEIVKFYADGVTSPDPMGLFFTGNTGTQPCIFGNRIYWVSADVANGARGNPLKSCALDGTDVQVIDDCDGGDTDLSLALE